MLSIAVLCTTYFVSCNNKKAGPDVSHIPVAVKLQRLEPAVFGLDSNNLSTAVPVLVQQNAFAADYFTQLLGINPAALTPDAEAGLKQFLRSYRPVFEQVQSKYKNMADVTAQIEDGFRHVKYYYPNYQLPRVITFLAPFDAPGAVLTKTHLGLGLQQFAGKDFAAYQDPQIQEMYPAYISRRFDQEYLAPAALKAIADDIYPDQSTGRPLIEQMVEKGKAWYLLHQFMPDAADSVLWGYTGKQINWLQENEGNIWGYLLSNENLYSIEPVTIQNYLGDAPFTQGMPESSPGNIGQWVGLRIVEQWVEKNSKLSLPEILATPAKQIFDESKYRPK